MAAFERITLDEAWNLPIIQSFNDLSYLKAKDKHDKEFIEEQKRAAKMSI